MKRSEKENELLLLLPYLVEMSRLARDKLLHPLVSSESKSERVTLANLMLPWIHVDATSYGLLALRWMTCTSCSSCGSYTLMSFLGSILCSTLYHVVANYNLNRARSAPAYLICTRRHGNTHCNAS